MAEQPQGTEYTLQGVMRFLQIEWHSHERARNAWDIERAEMKAKIAKQEGDCRSAKKLNETLDRQIRMLEKALKHERAKNKAIAMGEEPPTEEAMKKEWNGKIGFKGDGPFEDSKSTNDDPTESERDAQRDKSRHFLQKCVEEITYLLTPPAHPIPPQQSSQSLLQFANQQDVQAPSEEAYLHRQQLQQAMQQHQNIPKQGQPPSNLSYLPSLANNHQQPLQPARPTTELYQQQQPTQQQAQPQAQLMSRQINTQQPISSSEVTTSTNDKLGQQAQTGQSRPSEDQVERITHSFDSFGRPISSVEEGETSLPLINDDTDGWNFDEGGTLLESTQEPSQPRRPDTDLFPAATNTMTAKSPPRSRRKSSGSGSMTRRRSDGAHEIRELSTSQGTKAEGGSFKVRFQLRGHLDVVRSIIFTGGGSPSEPEICTTGDDGMIKRWIIPASYSNYGNTQNQQSQNRDQPPPSTNNDLDIQSYFTHRGHEGIVTCLAACPASSSFSTGGRSLGDGWIFSGGQDATVRVWERGRVDPKATLEGHTDAIWTVCLLPASSNSVFGSQDPSNPNANAERILLASGSADHTIKIWAVSAPPQLSSPQNPPGGRRGSRRHSVTSGSGFPSSPQPSTASGIPFHYTLVHSIKWPDSAAASPTCISPLGPGGDNFVVSYSDSSVLIFDTRTGEEVVGMASSETYDGTAATGVNAVVVSSHNKNADGSTGETNTSEDENVVQQIVSGHEDRYIRFYDAVSGQCTYSMLAHPASIAALALSPDGRELVSAGHDASLRFWSLEKRACVQEINSHRVVRGEGVVSVVWSQDGKWVVSGGGDGVIKVFGR